MKKIFSLLMCIIILATSAIIIAPAAFATADGADIPVVHVVGQGAGIARMNEAGEKETVYPLQIPEGYINEKVEIFLPVFAKAFFTQEWDEFCDVLYECLSPIFSQMALDKNGEASDGSFVDWGWSKESLADKIRDDGKFGVADFEFHYDWRLDPLVTADTLHQYIEDVMEVTGATEVALYGRCLGSNIVAAYMQKYNGEYVSEAIHYASAIYGATQCSKIFTGEIYLHADGVDRFIYDIDSYGIEIDKYLMEFLQAFVTLLGDTYGLDIACWAVNNVFEDIYLDIIPRVIVESYGTFPGYWSMVSIDDFARAKETVFYGSDVNEYAGLISKIENYRNTVQLTFKDTVKAQQEQGIEFANIVKYGMQTVPITKNSDDLSDGLVTVNEGSFGATTTLVTENFSEEYVNRAIANRTAGYISPDRQIDASTCLAPDTTWFIKNLFHMTFPSCVNGLVSDIVNHKGFTVNSNSEYPQYLVYDKESKTLSPMTADNLNTTDRWNVTYFEALTKFFEFIFNYLKGLVTSK